MKNCANRAKKKLIRATTISSSLVSFCSGLLSDLSEDYDVIAVSSPDQLLEDFGEREKVKVIGVPMARHISLIKDLRALYKMIRLFRKETPDIVHSMTPKAGLICMLAGWITGVPIRIHTFTGLIWPTSRGFMRRILMLTDRITCACATHIIPEGEGVKMDLIKGIITRKPLRILGYGNVRGVNLNYYDLTREVLESSKGLLLPDSFTFVFVGRVVGDKGINELVAAYERLYAEHRECRLIIVGRYEPELDPLKPETIKAINDCESIISVGQKEDVRPYYAASDCFVLPSYREGFPNSVLEAGAMRLPSIVTDINGSREIISNGYNGLIVPPRDPDKLYLAMKTIVEDTSLRNMMASVARPVIASRFEQGFVRGCLKVYYKEVLARA